MAKEEFTVRNLWLAIYLAHDAEEDEEPRKWEILPWALGVNWQQHLKSWAAEKQALWRRINFRVFVTAHQCNQVMALAPDHQAWSRRRAVDHGGAKRMRKEETLCQLELSRQRHSVPAALLQKNRTVRRVRRGGW